MAFFASKKESDTKQKVVRPVVVKTSNVAKELINIASTNRVDVATLDFNILDMQTLTRKKTASNNEPFNEISLTQLAGLYDNKLLLDPDFEIKQSYEIEVFTKKLRPNYDNFHFSIGVNATMCKEFLSVNAGSRVPFISSFAEDMLEIINKKRVRANLLVGLFDGQLHDLLEQMNAKLIVNKVLNFEQHETFVIAQAIEPEPTIDDAIIFHYKQKEGQDGSNKVDYSKRNFIQSVVKDELIIEYIKPKKGGAGRNCRGEYLSAKDPKVEFAPSFKLSSKIAAVETLQHIEYKAIENGYIVFENETYDIRDELDINEVSFKATGSIETKLDAAVTLKVKEKDIFKDAVGMGMEVEVSEIDVEGNVGPKASVRAKKATIQGQTHQSSFVKADELSINIHKGEAHGDNVHITRLEQGSVVANNVNVTQAIGGHIRAKEIIIELVGSHVNATASHRIEIKKMHGSENRFTIDPLAVESIDDNVGEKENELEKLDERLKFLKREVEKYKLMLQNNESSYLEVKKKLIHYKKNNIAMPDAFVKSFKQYQKYQQQLGDLMNEEKLVKEERELLNLAINTIQNSIYAARVVNHDRWVGYNEIRFKLIDPPMDIVYSPPEGSTEKIFALVKTAHDEYIIKAVKE